MKIKTGEIAENKDKNVISSVQLAKGTRNGTLKLIVNGQIQDNVAVKGTGSSGTVIGGGDTAALWEAINRKVDISFFDSLFTVYDNTNLKITTNTYTQTPDNLEISVGTWTEEYLSALGKNSEGGGGGGGTGTVTGIAVGMGSDPIYPDYETGIVTIPAYPTKVSQLINDSNYITNSYLSNNYYTRTDADSKFMTIAAFERVFNILDENGTKINHPYSSDIDSIKALKGLWTEQYLSALGQNSEGGEGGGGTGTVTSIQVAPNTYRDPDSNGIIDLSNDVVSSTDRTKWDNAATSSHTHSNKSVLDTITSAQVASWNNVASIIGEDSDTVINKWNEVVAFLATYTEADTLANLLSNKLDVQFFSSIFTVYDSNGNAIVPNTYTQVVDNLKIMVGAWTEQYLSALGKNSEGGGGGTGDVSHIKISSNPDVYLDPVDGIIDMSSYAAIWNNKQNVVTDLATIRSNASHGNTAYSWGNHANAGYALASNTVSDVAYNITGKKLTKTINGNTTDIVSASTLVTDGGGAKASTTITAGSGLTGGGDLSSNRTINVASANAAITVNADNIKLNVINDYTTTTNNTIIPLAAARGKDLNDRLAILESWFEVDSDGNVKTKDMPNGTHRGFYTESFVSALGSNSEGGGSGAGLEDVWDSLTNQQGTVITDNTKIAIAHIPDTSSTYGYLKSSALSGYATQTWVNQQGFLTTHQTLYTLSIYGGTTKVLDFKPNANASIYIKAGGDISLTNDTTNKYITLSYTHPTNGANTTISAADGKVLSAITVNSLGHVTSVSSKTLASADIPDISATYATASRATTLEGYFTDGVAKVAAKLNTGTTTYTAWGQTYWSSGVPQSVSGHLYLNNGNAIYSKDTDSSNVIILNLNSTNILHLGYGANAAGIDTYINGNNIYLRYGSSTSTGFALTSSGNVGIGTTSPSYKLHVVGTVGISNAITLTGSTASARRIYFGDTSHYIELTSTGFHFSHGVYSDSFVSALGANSSGGGSGTFDEEAMWTALGTTSSAKVIASSHIPNLSASKITSGTFASARIPIATASAVGGIKVGTTLAISDGVLNQKSGIATAGTYRSVTVDTYGRVTAGTNPTTLSGYGITNAYTKTQVDTALSGYLPLSGGTMTGTLGKSDNYLIKPVADYRTDVNTITGCITITLPADIGNTMVSMWIDVYNYKTNTSFSVHCGGYTYTNSTWANNPFVMVYGASHRVRFGHNGTSFVIYIGETNSTWNYPQVTVRDVILGFKQTYANWYKNWTISFATSVSNVTADYTRYAITSSNISSQSVNHATKATQDGSGNTITSTYLPLSGGTITGNLVVNGTTTLDDYLTTKTYIDVDRSPYGAISLGYQLNVLRARCMNAGTGTFAYNSVISLFGSGETGTAVNNLGVRLGSQSGATWISAGESGKTLSSQYTDMCNTENVYITADGAIRFLTGCANDGTSFTDAATIASNGNVTINKTLLVDTISNSTGTYGLLSYHPASWTGVSNTQWGVGATDSQGVIRSSNTNLVHYKGSTNYTICDGSNTYVTSGKGYINGTEITTISGTAGNADKVDNYHAFGAGTGNIVKQGYININATDTEKWYKIATITGNSDYYKKFLLYISTFYAPGSGNTQNECIISIVTRASSSYFYHSVKGLAGNLAGSYIRLYYNTYSDNLELYYKFPTSTTSNRTVITRVLAENRRQAQLLDNIVLENNTAVEPTSGWSYNEMSYVTYLGNATTATTLATSRTIWGQSFNGSANISGDMSSVGTITFSEANAVNVDKYGNLKFNSDSSTSYWRVATYSDVVGIVVKNSDGYVGIGTTTPGYKLGVVGTFGATGAASFGSTLSVTGATTLSSTLSVTGASTLTGNITAGAHVYLANNKYINWKDTDGTNRTMLYLTSGNDFSVGYGTIASKGNTVIIGTNIYIKANSTTANAVTISSAKNLTCAGEVTASSDERLKTIVGDGNLDLRYIANAPNILFKWNNGQDDKVHGGSLAQYFLHGAKHFVLGSDKDYYSLNYGALATSMAISIAKEVLKHEDEITRLKKVVVKQAEEIVDLKNKVSELKERRVA